MWVKQCHKPPMTGNGFYMFTPIEMVFFLGDGKHDSKFYPHCYCTVFLGRTIHFTRFLTNQTGDIPGISDGMCTICGAPVRER